MRSFLPSTVLLLLAVGAPAAGQEVAERSAGSVTVPAGLHRPLHTRGSDGVPVEAFHLDSLPVTAADYLAFVRAEPRWRRDRAPALLAGDGYLASWRDELDPGTVRGPLDRPVTQVSWFAAAAFCEAAGGRLPTTDEWEYAASFPEEGWDGTTADLHRRFLELWSDRPRPDALPGVSRAVRTRLGVRGLHGLVQEWTDDFNNQMVSGAGRDDRGLDRELFCAAGSAGVPDPSDYAAFLRASFRASLEGGRGALTLGFRCAYDPASTSGTTP